MRDSFKKIIFMPVFLASIVILSVVLIFAIYAGVVYKNLKEEVITTLSETSLQTAKALKNQITGDRRAIEDVAMMISNSKHETKDIIESLKKVTVNHRLLRMGIVMPDRSVITTDGKIIRLPDRLYIRDALKGKSSVSERLTDIVDGGTIIVYGAPIYSSDWKRVEAVLFGTFSIEEYHASLTTNAFDGNGYSYVVKKDGSAISASDNAVGGYEIDNIIDALIQDDSANKEAAKTLKNGMLSGLQGHIEFTSSNENEKPVKKYMYYAPLDVNDWYLLMAVPVNVLDRKLLSTLGSVFMLSCIVVIICTIILVMMLKNQKQAKNILEGMVYVDKITGNMSYEKFKLDAKAILDKSRCNDKYAIVSLDVDKFKYINDMFGYDEGDNLIRYIDSVFLKNCKNDELAAHVDADDFILLLKYEDKKSLCDRLEMLIGLIEEYKRPDSKNYKILVSMGVYEVGNSDIDMDTMKDRAEIPRKQAKSDKSASYAFYDEAVREKILSDREMENRMTKALEQGEFIVLYQPKFWTSDRSLAGAEALVRWKQKDGSLLAPGAFIPLFEENGFIVQLDRYVFEQICKDIKRWIEEGYSVLPISSNLSRKNIVIENLADEYEAIVKDIGIPRNLVALELTETAFVENDSTIGDFVTKMNEKGFSVIMDDFGIGFSSIGLLIKMEIDTLKLDRALVQDIDNNDKSRTVVELMIKMMHRWNVKVNAEGIETIRQFENLVQLRCDEVQGFYFAKPMPCVEYENLMAAQTAQT